jgi:hypothetical protein
MSNAIEEIMNGAYVDLYLTDTVPSDPSLQADKWNSSPGMHFLEQEVFTVLNFWKLLYSGATASLAILIVRRHNFFNCPHFILQLNVVAIVFINYIIGK